MRHQATNWLYHILASSPTAQDGIELCIYTVRIGMASTQLLATYGSQHRALRTPFLVLPLAPEVTCQLKLASAIQRCWQALLIVISSFFCAISLLLLTLPSPTINRCATGLSR
eukprot:6130-Heterococcus_DN1.PRE.1